MTELGVYEYIHRRTWITEDEVKELVGTIGDRLRSAKNTKDIVAAISPLREKFLFDQLNGTIREAMSFELRERITPVRRKELRELTKKLQAYTEGIDRLRQNGFDIALIPEKHRKDAARLLETLDVDQGARYRGQNTWEAAFIPEGMALYSTVFGVEPRTTSNPDYDDLPGPTIQFLQNAVVCVQKRQRDLFGYVPTPEFPSHWRVPSDGVLRNRISELLRSGKRRSNTEHSWQQHRDFFVEHLYNIEK